MGIVGSLIAQRSAHDASRRCRLFKNRRSRIFVRYSGQKAKMLVVIFENLSARQPQRSKLAHTALHTGKLDTCPPHNETTCHR